MSEWLNWAAVPFARFSTNPTPNNWSHWNLVEAPTSPWSWSMVVLSSLQIQVFSFWQHFHNWHFWDCISLLSQAACNLTTLCIATDQCCLWDLAPLASGCPKVTPLCWLLVACLTSSQLESISYRQETVLESHEKQMKAKYSQQELYKTICFTNLKYLKLRGMPATSEPVKDFLAYWAPNLCAFQLEWSGGMWHVSGDLPVFLIVNILNHMFLKYAYKTRKRIVALSQPLETMLNYSWVGKVLSRFRSDRLEEYLQISRKTLRGPAEGVTFWNMTDDDATGFTPFSIGKIPTMHTGADDYLDEIVAGKLNMKT